MIFIHKALNNKINCLFAYFGFVTMSFNTHHKSTCLQQRGAVNNKQVALFSHKTTSIPNTVPSHATFSTNLTMFE